ncbi:MAG: right-handed parallel beta-helix repeat-containing protein [Pseudomonadota bacterium]|nr:right-handed parallel beta-helix repeat-containing protein [Pseudomonadota bacterium]
MANIEQFSIRPDSGEDATLAVRDALEACRDRKDPRLVFPPGRYDFWPDKATERYLFISNNTEGLKRIAFPLFNFDGFEIEGQGAEFVFHGPILPFAVLGSTDIRLSGFSVDWKRPFHSEGRIAEIGDGWLDLVFSDEFPYKILGNRLVFMGESGEEYRFSNLLEFDPNRHETAFQALDNYGIENRHEAKEIQPGRVRLTMALASAPTLGNVFVFGSDHRKCPGIFISDSQRIEIENVTLHHGGGMGIIAQLTTDVAVRHLQVTPPPGKGRLTSLTADATHFVSCRGKIEITDCLFENQMDDPVNIHGIYARISARVSDRTLEVALMHGEQMGIDLFAPGDTAELVQAETLGVYYAGAVKSVRRLNKKVSVLTFAEDLPAQIKAGDAAVCREANPDVTICGCTSRGNRARGFLLSTSGRVLIEGNYFHTPGAAILVAGDANYWFESGPVRDVTIRNNHFDNCNYGVWGRACIDICPEIAPEHRHGTVYHRNIRVENNMFDIFDPRLLAAQCVAGLTFAGNTLRPSTAYPAPDAGGEAFAVTDCADVVIQPN